MYKTSIEKPSQVSLEIGENGLCKVILRDDIFEEISENDGQQIFSFNEFEIIIPYKNELEDLINDNFKEWVDYGRSIENMPDTMKELSDKGKISLLIRENNQLKEIVSQLSADNELLQQCIMDLAGEIYA